MKKLTVLAVLALCLSLAFAAPPAGKGPKHKIEVSTTTPAADEVFTVTGQHFRGRVTLWFGPAHGFVACFGTPSRGKGEVAIACSLPQFSLAVEPPRDLSLGAFGEVFEEVEATLADGTPTLLSIKRGSVLVFVGG